LGLSQTSRGQVDQVNLRELGSAELLELAGCTTRQIRVVMFLAERRAARLPAVAPLARELGISEPRVRQIESSALRRAQRFVGDPVGLSLREREVLDLVETYVNEYGRWRPNTLGWVGGVLGISRQCASKYYHRAKQKQARAAERLARLDDAA
jgi:hypothetical protein